MKPETMTEAEFEYRRSAIQYEMVNAHAELKANGMADTTWGAWRLDQRRRYVTAYYFPRYYTLGKMKWRD